MSLAYKASPPEDEHAWRSRRLRAKPHGEGGTESELARMASAPSGLQVISCL